MVLLSGSAEEELTDCSCKMGFLAPVIAVRSSNDIG